MLLRTTLKTPVGALSLISREHILIAAGFTSQDELLSSISNQDRQLESKKVNQIPIISDLVSDYFDGDLRALDGIKVDQEGEKFSQSAWRVMRKISPGKTLTYADLAKRAGSEDAVRAAGSACARNLIALVVPCHRIVKTGGALGNYAYGLKYMSSLLHRRVRGEVHHFVGSGRRRATNLSPATSVPHSVRRAAALRAVLLTFGAFALRVMHFVCLQ